MDIQIPIPAREPGERADLYLIRLQSWEALQEQTKKEIARQERRIRSEVERALIKRAVREAYKPRPAPRAFIKNPRGPRYYRIPDNLWILLIFAPLYLLISIIWQDKNRQEGPKYTEIPISRIEK
jgi:hypothetical protein